MNSFRHFILTLFAVITVALGCSCRHQGNPTSFAFIDHTRIKPQNDASDLQAQAGRTVFLNASPVEPLARPVCPSGREFARQAFPITLIARVSVDDAGRVQGVERSVADFSVPTRFSFACLQAIKVAVTQWRFEPAQLRILETRNEREALTNSKQTTDTLFDVAFTFSPSGQRRSAISQK